MYINMSFLNKTANSPNVVYFNGDVSNTNTVDNASGDPVLSFYENRGVEILNDASEYYLNISRWQADIGADLPLFIPQMDMTQTNPNQTVYTITIGCSLNGNNSGDTQPIMFVPETNGVSVPIMNQSFGQDYGNKYYWLYTHGSFVDMVNTTLQTIWTNIQEEMQEDYGNIRTKVPKMIYNSDTGKFSLYCDSYGFGGNDRTSAGSSNDESFTIYFNSPMFLLFRNFQNIYNPVNNPIVNTNQIIVKNMMESNLVTLSDGTKYYVMSQEWLSTDSWTPISSLVFTSNLLQTEPEMIGEVQNLGVSASAFGTSQNLTDNVITDISLPLTGGAQDYKQVLTYNPSGFPRLIELGETHRNLNIIDFSLYWKCRHNGQLYRISIPNGGSASIKLSFIKKSLFNSDILK
jgi:hypothetical protein